MVSRDLILQLGEGIGLLVETLRLSIFLAIMPWTKRVYVSYTSHFRYIVRNLSIVMDEFNCPSGARDISNCSYNLMTHDCSHSEDIVLVCSGGAD